MGCCFLTLKASKVTFTIKPTATRTRARISLPCHCCNVPQLRPPWCIHSASRVPLPAAFVTVNWEDAPPRLHLAAPVGGGFLPAR